VETHAQKVVANFSNADVSMFYWQSDKQVIYSVINVDHGGSMGRPGSYAVDRDGKDFTTLSPTSANGDSVPAWPPAPLRQGHRVLQGRRRLARTRRI
jgi:hypothetical protein